MFILWAFCERFYLVDREVQGSMSYPFAHHRKYITRFDLKIVLDHCADQHIF